LVQGNTVQFQWNEFQMRATPKYLSDHSLILNRVKAARGVHQVPTWNKQGGASGGNVDLHFEHLPPFFWCPIPPHISVLSRGSCTGAWNIGKNGIKTGWREPPKMTPIVLGHNDVGKSQTALVTDQHVESAGNRFVGHHDPVGMESLAKLSGFRTRGSAHVQSEDFLLGGEQAYGKHARRFLARYPSCFVKQGHQPLRQTFGGFAPRKRHHKRCLGRHPWDLNGSNAFHLFNRPLSVGSMERDTERFWKRFKRCVQPNFLVPTQVANKGGE
tara:strand:- start:761 stop:1573 length:813 start_codon:yes stop_codon:yes gene_type:complete